MLFSLFNLSVTNKIYLLLFFLKAFLEHFLEQYKTFFQSLSHFFLQLNGLLQTTQILEGNFFFNFYSNK
tara:strand:- start:891 stop:1097 length:207 start_codon:yes stop_codon:yes gene_type:complete